MWCSGGCSWKCYKIPRPHFWQGPQSLVPATRNDIWMSKVVRTPWCFSHFNFEMCFAPQRRALFRHLNFQKWSGAEAFCTVWLGNVLRATTACNFSSLIWPAGSAPAALASLLFDPLEPQIIGKTQCFATFLPFRAPGSSFFWNFLFSDLLSSALFFSILLLHLCFSSVYIVGSLTSKRPSKMALTTYPGCWGTWILFFHSVGNNTRNWLSYFSEG